MPYCRNCGNEIKDTEKFCSNCGASNGGEKLSAPVNKFISSKTKNDDVNLQNKTFFLLIAVVLNFILQFTPQIEILHSTISISLLKAADYISYLSEAADVVKAFLIIGIILAGLSVIYVGYCFFAKREINSTYALSGSMITSVIHLLIYFIGGVEGFIPLTIWGWLYFPSLIFVIAVGIDLVKYIDKQNNSVL